MNLFPVLDECVINTTRHGSFVARVGSLDRHELLMWPLWPFVNRSHFGL